MYPCTLVSIPHSLCNQTFHQSTVSVRPTTHTVEAFGEITGGLATSLRPPLTKTSGPATTSCTKHEATRSSRAAIGVAHAIILTVSCWESPEDR